MGAIFAHDFVVPFGAGCGYPKDILCHRIARSMQADTALRQRLSRYCYVGNDPSDPIGRVEAAWKSLLQVESLHLKLRRAIKSKKIERQLTRTETLKQALRQNVIDEKDYDRLVQVENLRDLALVVDEFDFSSLVRFNANMPDTATVD